MADIRIRLASALAVASLAFGCAGTSAPSAESIGSKAAEDSTQQPASIRGGALIRLADEARLRGDYVTAKNRYERVLGFDPHAAPALVGMGRIALAEGDLDSAAAAFERAAAAAPDLDDPWLALAEVKARRGDREGARRDLDRALEIDGGRPATHAQYLALTGRARLKTARDLAAALETAEVHPYDPRARLAAGRFLASAGRGDEAIEHLRSALWLADLDPRAASAAWELLQQIDPVWSERRIVTVAMLGDEVVRGEPGWKFALRNNLLYAASQLAPILDTWFVPVRIGAVKLARARPDLPSLHAAFRDQVPSTSASAITASFTGLPIPNKRVGGKLGMAEFLGRTLSVRLPPGERHSRTLIHELLHIYGAIHVASGLESVMNPTGSSLRLDPLNYEIVQVMSSRAFRRGGFEANIVGSVDVEAAIGVYTTALRVNLRFRKLGALEAMEQSGGSRLLEYRGIVKARELDPHLADVSRLVASLWIANDRRIQGLKMLEIAGALYGRRTKDGIATRRAAEKLRVALEREYGLRPD